MRSTGRSSFSFLAAILFFISAALASESDHKYQPDDPLVLWAMLHTNGVGLGGNELIDSRIDIKFQKPVDKTTICEIELDEAQATQFKDAIDRNYWFEFFMDDLPLWGYVGEFNSKRKDDNQHMLYTHKSITVKYNKNQIIEVNLTQQNPKPLEVGRTLDMTYSVQWIPTDVSFARRFDVYLDHPFFEHQERSNCHYFYSMLCFHIIHFRLCQWWNVLTPWW